MISIIDLSSNSIKEYCISKPGALEDYPYGPEQTVFQIASKMFALISMKNNKAHILLKCDPFVSETLQQQYPAVKPGYYLNESNWSIVTLDGTVPDNEVFWMIDHSYELVTKSLSKIEKDFI